MRLAAAGVRRYVGNNGGVRFDARGCWALCVLIGGFWDQEMFHMFPQMLSLHLTSCTPSKRPSPSPQHLVTSTCYIIPGVPESTSPPHRWWWWINSAWLALLCSHVLMDYLNAECPDLPVYPLAPGKVSDLRVQWSD